MMNELVVFEELSTATTMEKLRLLLTIAATFDDDELNRIRAIGRSEVPESGASTAAICRAVAALAVVAREDVEKHAADEG